MPIRHAIMQFFRFKPDGLEFRRAQYRELARQIPLMYAIVIVNMVMLAFTYHGKAPEVLSVWIPACFVAICLFRGVRMALGRSRLPSDDAIEQALYTVIVLACVMGIAVSLWSLVLFSYGNIFTKVQNTFFTGITIITVMTCLRPLRQVAPMLYVLVVIPTAIFLSMQDHSVFRAIAINMLLAIGGMIIVMQRSHSDFRQRIQKQVQLDCQRAQLQALNEEVSLVAQQDSLTGLANRRCFFEHLDRRIADYDDRASQPFAAGLIDLDGFKPVNDRYGHAVGDALLSGVASRLRGAIRDGDIVARLGGDEFAVIQFGLRRAEEADLLARRIRASIAQPFDFDGTSLAISTCIGTVVSNSRSQQLDVLLQEADEKLYAQKRSRPVVGAFRHMA